MKTCRVCGVEKHLTDFHPRKGAVDGVRTDCKVCRLSNQSAYRSLDPEKARNAVRRCRLRDLFGMTLEGYAELLAAQGGCAICKTTTPGGRGTFHVDHCHTTGKVRGLLCHHCNVGLGHFQDRIDKLQAAITYLEVSHG